MGHATKITGIVLIALACAAAPKPAPKKPEVVWLEKVWSSAPHNAFTDLVRYKERWYCALREGQAARSADGAIRILTSLDGEVWKPAARIASPGGDLRYPKLSASTDGRLMLVAVEERQGIVWERHQSLLWLSPDGRTWGAPMSVCEPNVQLGRLTWHNGLAFGAGYSSAHEEYLRIYAARQPDRFEALTPKIFSGQAPGEASLLFLEDGSALCLAQRGARGATAALGRAKPPYRGWMWTDLNVNLESPNMLMLPDSKIVAAGRVTSGGKSHLALLWLDPEDNQLREFLTLQSGGDAGGPGLAWRDGLLWVSYYSSHDGKAGVYVAKVRIGEK
ncbi:MAG: exo-alpha-sialidase [Acidobacteria bacterium]|nr:exo-alpha-sialidase [Acidobacteriota bacterium]